MSATQEVILVNEQDVEVGTMEKLEAHQKAILHRAFSVFIFNKKGEMLLQQRARNKYHSAELWTNACCSHPSPGEETLTAAKRRLVEEMGFSTPLTKIFEFTYKSHYENGLTEHEFDHVYTGIFDGTIKPDPDEVKDYCFKSLDEIEETLQSHPAKYTSWFHIAFPKLKMKLAEAGAVV
ncbi:isopentenyl-diphosphate Delta-isomerase [Flavitalea sp.]|nr:isopentenyl-diphosphate Delta-isomerase [Flavitalea sp.]